MISLVFSNAHPAGHIAIEHAPHSPHLWLRVEPIGAVIRLDRDDADDLAARLTDALAYPRTLDQQETPA